MKKILCLFAALLALSAPAFAQGAAGGPVGPGPSPAATQVRTNPSSTNASFFPLFVPSNSAGSQLPSTSSGLSYNPAGGNLTATNLIGATTITNSSLTAGRIVLTTTSGQETDSSLFQYSTSNKEFVLNGAGSDTIVGGPGLSWNAGSGDVQHFQLGASNQLCLWGSPSSWQQNLCVSLAGAVSMPQLAASSAAQTGTVCWTTGTGNLTVDTTTTCLLSLEELKNIRASINPAEAIWTSWKLRPIWLSWPAFSHTGRKLHGVRYQELAAFLVAAVNGHTILLAILFAWNALLTVLVLKKRR